MQPKMGKMDIDYQLEKMAEDDIDRATLWRKGCEDKYENIPDEKTAEKAKAIDELKKKVLEGSLTVIGSHDILTMALGTSERAGRVRSVGTQGFFGRRFFCT